MLLETLPCCCRHELTCNNRLWSCTVDDTVVLGLGEPVHYISSHEHNDSHHNDDWLNAPKCSQSECGQPF